MRKTGHYEYIANKGYFIPDPLPPKNPPLKLDEETISLYGQTMLELGRLNETANRLPDKKRFIKAYVTKEALLSSDIEGIHTTMLEVFTQPLLESKPTKDTQLVMNYTKALDVAVSMIQKGLPISTRVILKAHEALMQIGEGDKSDPGNFRKQSVKVGNLIPPPANEVPKLMTELEKYINTDETLPPLIKAGLSHVQFEIIHPFLDGNGRIGRLLIVLILIENRLLSKPILYPSYYFKKHKLEYYRQLDLIRTNGDFESWIKYYLMAIKCSSFDAYRRSKDIEKLEYKLRTKFENEKIPIKLKENRIRTLSILFSSPVISTKELSAQLNVTYNTANKIITDFVKINLLTEVTQQKRGKLFRFGPYLDILEKEYED